MCAELETTFSVGCTVAREYVGITNVCDVMKDNTQSYIVQHLCIIIVIHIIH